MRAPVGGLFRHVLDLAAEQAARGHDVGLLADSTASDRLTDQRFAAIEPKLRLGLHRVPMSRKPGLGDLSAARLTTRIARERGVQVLHGHGAKGGAYARLAAPLLRSRDGKLASFYTPHGGSLNFSPGSIESRIYLGLETILSRLTDGLIFESDFARRIYAERIGLGGVAHRVIPNGLEPSDFVDHNPAPDAADILFIGELRAIKGVDVLLRAITRIRAERPVTAVIVGSGPDKESLESLCRELELEADVRFPGAMPAAEAFPLGRLLAVPSRAESFPYVVLEAGAAGMPLVATSAGGIPEIVAGTDTSLIAPDDVEALAAALGSILDDPAAASARAARLKSTVGAKFTVRAMSDAVLDFYAAALA
jgi:glycosyltransferase involved in cell wall biosynthesis